LVKWGKKNATLIQRTKSVGRDIMCLGSLRGDSTHFQNRFELYGQRSVSALNDLFPGFHEQRNSAGRLYDL